MHFVRGQVSGSETACQPASLPACQPASPCSRCVRVRTNGLAPVNPSFGPFEIPDARRDDFLPASDEEKIAGGGLEFQRQFSCRIDPLVRPTRSTIASNDSRVTGHEERTPRKSVTSMVNGKSLGDSLERHCTRVENGMRERNSGWVAQSAIPSPLYRALFETLLRQ